jgi:hypothetical protein
MGGLGLGPLSYVSSKTYHREQTSRCLRDRVGRNTDLAKHAGTMLDCTKSPSKLAILLVRLVICDEQH